MEDSRGKVSIDGVEQETVVEGTTDKPLKDVYDNDEEVGGEQVDRLKHSRYGFMLFTVKYGSNNINNKAVLQTHKCLPYSDIK